MISGHGPGPKQPAFCEIEPKEHYASAQKNENMNKPNSNSACVANISLPRYRRKNKLESLLLQEPALVIEF